MTILLALVLQSALAASEQTPRELEQQHLEILEALQEDLAVRNLNAEMRTRDVQQMMVSQAAQVDSINELAKQIGALAQEVKERNASWNVDATDIAVIVGGLVYGAQKARHRVNNRKEKV